VKPRPLDPCDLTRIVVVGDPVLANDGRLAFARTWLDETADAVRHDVAVLDPQTGEQLNVTNEGGGAWRPRWSPDGSQLAVLSAVGGRSQPVLWDPETQRIRPLAVLPGEAVDLDWSPDGTRLAVSWLSRQSACGGPALAEPPAAVRIDGRAGLVVEARHVSVLGVDGADDKDIVTVPGEAWHGRWSPDGHRLAFLTVTPGDSADRRSPKVCAVRMRAAGELDPTVKLGGPAVAFTWSPDGRQLAYLGPRGDDEPDLDCRLFLCTADGEWSPAELAQGWDRNMGSTVRGDDLRGTGTPVLVWSAVTGLIYLPVADGGCGSVGWVSPDDGSCGVLLGGKRACLDLSLDPAGRTLAFVSSAPADPGDVWLADLVSGHERRLTDVNGWLGSVELAPTQALIANGAGALPIEGWLTRPAGAANDPCPLVVSVHGGPHYSVGWRFMAESQRLAARGYAVLSGNPAGSGGYGRGFAAAIRGGWGSRDWVSLEALIDAAVTQPGIDGGRVAITGVSYGGYMAMRAVTVTSRFSAAISENGISDLLALWGSGATDASWLTAEMDGAPWLRPDNYVDASPLTAADRIRTPLLLIHAELDQICPISQSEQMLAALRRLGRPVELIRLDGEGHLINLLGRPSRRRTRAEAVDAWLDRYMPLRGEYRD
jgi:dipeptidyl aminopeptidase/acylaminoacyl peptidase